MARNIHGNLIINNGDVTVQGDQLFSNGSNRQISVDLETGTDGRTLTILAGGSSNSNATGGNLFLNAGDATNGGAATGGDVFINAGNNGASGFEKVYIGGNKTTASSNYTLTVTSNSAGNGVVGIRTTSPSATLHLKINSITTPSIDSNTAILLENSTSFTGETGISMLGGIVGKSYINFGDSAQEVQMYVHGGPSGLEIGSFGGGGALKVSNSSDRRVSIGTASTPLSTLHVLRSGSSLSWTPGAQNVAIFQHNSSVSQDCRVNIISGNSGLSSIYLSDTAATGRGRIEYDNSSDQMNFKTNGNSIARVYLTNEEVLKTNGQAFKTTYINNVSTSLSRQNQFVLITNFSRTPIANTINLPNSPVEGQAIYIRTLIFNATTTLSGNGVNIQRIGGSVVASFSMSQQIGYMFIYSSRAGGRWFEMSAA
jgi:hypothetical protein